MGLDGAECQTPSAAGFAPWSRGEAPRTRRNGKAQSVDGGDGALRTAASERLTSTFRTAGCGPMSGGVAGV